MKKLLFINGHLNPGGVEKSLLDILCNLDYSKYEVELLLLEELGSYADLLPKEVSVRLVDLHHTYGAFGSCVARCIRQGDWQSLWRRLIFLLSGFLGQRVVCLLKKSIVGTKKYDCVIGFRPGIAAALAIYATNASKRILWWHHGEMNLSKQEQRNFHEKCKRADQLISVSNGCAEMLRQHFPDIADKITVIPNMVDVAEIRRKANAYVPYEKKADTIHFVTVGRLSPEKHIENAIYAAHMLKEEGIKFQWHLVGDGVCAERLKALAVEQQVEDCVFFSGSQPNPYPYIQTADVMVHTSYVESQCLVVLEAMAIGTPCVVTESLGPKEFCVDEKNCILVKPGVKELLTGIKTIMAITSCNEFIEAAKETVYGFVPTRVMDQIEGIL